MLAPSISGLGKLGVKVTTGTAMFLSGLPFASAVPVNRLTPSNVTTTAQNVLDMRDLQMIDSGMSEGARSSAAKKDTAIHGTF
jgi:hypothetical protein